ncbi:nitrilase [Trypanosoma rangeli]|uniref:Nitrilase n=1 Tax=Trypanosoma rangeli TaxID=5698 RepID=A0A422P3W9_TRYRA|nr:nitrilase [Trypanosoma rangeli]RNF12364.1 nitrilase [Trypanosoma rangeli]|eukprot:RNF12364.1 nitrilase [Trypanosoma rangeli]
MSTMRVTLCQMAVGKSKAANLAKAVGMITSAAKRGANLAVLPECFMCPYGTKYFEEYSEEVGPGFPTYDAISKVAKENNIWVIAGSIPERSDEKIYNSCMVFDSTGKLKHVHRKIHLFRIRTDTVRMDEGEVLSAGNTVSSVSMNDKIKFGVGICFDVRYPLLACKYAHDGTSLLVYPGAFNMVTGPLHWELLARARAVDNQQFVILCSPARDLDADYVAWGHSMVVDPMGKVIADANECEGYVDAELDLDLIQSTRETIPIIHGTRHDMVKLFWK